MIREYDFATAASETYGGSIANQLGVGVITIDSTVDNADLTQIERLSWIASGTGIPNNAVVTSVAYVVADPVQTYTFTIDQPATTEGGGTFSFGKSDYSLPSDFQRPIDNTFWDRTRYWQMRGPLSPQQWQLFKSSMIGNATVQRRYRFRRINGVNRISIDPTPFDDGSRLVFEYVSNAWCESASGTAQTSWQADTDVGVLDEYLLQLGLQWRFLQRLGLVYSDAMADYEREVSKAVATDGASAVLSLVATGSLTLLGPFNLPEGYYPGGATDGSGFVIGVSGIGTGVI